MNTRDNAYPEVPQCLLFIDDSELVSLGHLREFLIAEISRAKIQPKIESSIITQAEGANLLLARLHTWLERRGFDNGTLDILRSVEAMHEMEGFLCENMK